VAQGSDRVARVKGNVKMGMKESYLRRSFAAAACLMGVQAAQAQDMPTGNTARFALGEVTSPPIGYNALPTPSESFCGRHPAECAIKRKNPVLTPMNEKNWAQIIKINKEVNAEIKPVSDLEQWKTEEYWTYPVTGRGDCEDYVLEKRRRLVKAGFDISALLITVVKDHKGDGHAVLTVRFDKGDYILDNNFNDIKQVNKTNYQKFVTAINPRDTGDFVRISGVEMVPNPPLDLMAKNLNPETSSAILKPKL
jgi:predicted transglutaminase-like cysteine proteinase